MTTSQNDMKIYLNKNCIKKRGKLKMIKKILNQFSNEYSDIEEKYVILQIGKERSIIRNTTNYKHYIIDNTYLMSLDEMGVIL